MTEKFCIDCKHYRKGFLGIPHYFGVGKCHAPQNTEIDKVTGKLRYICETAGVQRATTLSKMRASGYCNDAEWFEPK